MFGRPARYISPYIRLREIAACARSPLAQDRRLREIAACARSPLAQDRRLREIVVATDRAAHA
jgi:hypothetical protein